MYFTIQYIKCIECCSVCFHLMCVWRSFWGMGAGDTFVGVVVVGAGLFRTALARAADCISYLCM